MSNPDSATLMERLQAAIERADNAAQLLVIKGAAEYYCCEKAGLTEGDYRDIRRMVSERLPELDRRQN